MLTWLETLPLADWLRLHPRVYAAVSAVHILGLGVLFGTIAVVDLRLLGRLRALPVSAVRETMIPIAASALCLTLATGFLMFSIRAGHYAANPAFQVKLALIAVSFANILMAHAAPEDSRARQVAALLSLGLWGGTIFAGRWIAFT
ncbi:hypothetical protein [Arenibacterium sp. LLYu02]|uniref:hypothetical protein n=1 Tax=Arenibacterium sp. LLYu02 TaxID=3404132 RepID=UPI003B212476